MMKNSFQYNTCSIYKKKKMCRNVKMNFLKMYFSLRKIYNYFNNYNRFIFDFYLKTFDTENDFW